MSSSQDTARAFYGKAFEHKKKRDLADSMAEWADMSDGEQSFAVAHLLYLNLHAQGTGHRLLTQVRDLLEEVAESLTTAIEAGLPEEPEVDSPVVEVEVAPPPEVPPGGGEE